MKRLLNILGAFLALTFILLSCSESVDGSQSEGGKVVSRDAGATVSIKLHLLYADAGEWHVWAWKKPDAGSDANYCKTGWPGEFAMTAGAAGSDEYTYNLTGVDSSARLGIIFVKGSTQTSDIIVPTDKLTNNKELYFVFLPKGTDTPIYENAADCKGLKAAAVTDDAGNKIKLTIFGAATATASAFSVKDKNNTTLTLAATGGVSAASNSSITLTISDGALTKMPYSVTYTPEGGTAQTVKTPVSGDLVDKIFPEANGTDTDGLGVTIAAGGTTANFKTWAPMATSVQLLLFTTSEAAGTRKGEGKKETDYCYNVWATAPTECAATSADGSTIIDMTAADNGVWKADNVSITDKKYYKYRITNEGVTRDVPDLWHTVASVDSVASQIVSIDDASAKPTDWEASYTNPFGSTGTETKKYGDALIYEMHIRDWSGSGAAGTGGYDDGGSFEAFASDDNIEYLQNLGVTHVQILPMFDYAQTRADKKYNWGYNPWHYNVPESRYVKSSAANSAIDGTEAVKQLRAMIKKLHEAGIAVIMDVVYNHTADAGTEYSLYDMTAPKYFYRMTSSGGYSNGSGCGNEIATNHKMVKKYVIESLKHWMTDYHINGFRFDLMGVAEKSTMKAIYDELYKIDQNVLVYGEPWTGGDCAVVDGVSGAGKGTSGHGYGAFDDDFRDGLKGTDGFGGFHRGLVTGNITDTARVVTGLTGASGANNRNTTDDIGLGLHYIECHDNYTLFDKLLYSFDTSIEGDGEWVPKFAALERNLSSYIDLIKKKERLAAAFVLLAQGTPFLNGGQEFLRSKKGNPDSYSADNKGGHVWTEAEIRTCNLVDLERAKTYFDVVNTYRALIAFRQDNLTDFNGSNSSTAEAIKSGVIKYKTKNYIIYYNCTDEAVTLGSDNEGKVVSAPGITVLGYSGLGGMGATPSGILPYTINNKSTTIRKIPAQDFVILKKN